MKILHNFRSVVMLVTTVPFLASFATTVKISVSKGFGEWSLDGRSFYVARNDDKNFQATLFKNTEKSLVMVSFVPGRRLDRNLEQDPRVLAYYSSRLSGVGRAILFVSPKEREEVAQEAHNDINMCGALEDFVPSFMPVSFGDAKAPVIATTLLSTSVKSLIDQVSAEQMGTTVAALENLGTRYHASATPNASTDLIKSLWESNAPTSTTIVEAYDHSSRKSTTQQSLVLTIPSVGSTETVVLAAHLDSINSANQSQAPGADDNASGIAALTEILRVLKANQGSFQRNVEIHAYAAEEVGLLGSADIASRYANSGKTVTAMLQLDMIGYSATTNDTTLHLITTDTSPVLVRHLKDLTSIYLNKSWEVGTLAAGTSDHKSWTNNGYHSAFAFEHPTQYNHALHSTADTKSRIDFNLAARFAKLALAFVSHEAGLTAGIQDTVSAWESQNATSDKIKVAVFKSSTGGYRVAASLADSLKNDSVEICKVSSGEVAGCQAMNTNAPKVISKLTRDFFATSEDVEIANGDIWRINVYDTNGSLVAMRSIKLEKK